MSKKFTSQQATHVKSNGERLNTPSAQAIAQVKAMEPLGSTIGEHLQNTLLDAFQLTSTERAGHGENEPAASYSKAKIRSIAQSFTDAQMLITHLEGKIKVWRNEADSRSDEFKPEFTKWALGLAPTDGEMRVKTPEGITITVPVEVGVRGTVDFLFNCLGSLSNAALLGETARTGKNGKSKAGKESVFKNTKRRVQTGFADGGNENWQMNAGALYLVNGGISGELLCKAIDLVGAATKLLNNGQPAEAEKIFKILTGQIETDKRFSFDPSLIKGLITLRGYGLLISGTRQWIKELKEKDAEEAKKATWRNIESVELAQMVSTLNRREAFEEAHPELNPKADKIANSKVESPDTKATLPDAMVHPITWKDKAERRVRRLAALEYDKGISDEDLALMISDLSGEVEITEEVFNESYTEEEIKLYFAEVAFKASEADESETESAAATA